MERISGYKQSPLRGGQELHDDSMESFSFQMPIGDQQPNFVIKQKSLHYDPIRMNCPADTLFSNGRILPHAYPTIAPVNNPDRDRSSRNSSSRSRSSSGSSSCNQNPTSVSKGRRLKNPIVKSEQSNKELTLKEMMKVESNGRSVYGEKKFFKSFGSACRGCRAVEPSSIKKDVIYVTK